MAEKVLINLFSEQRIPNFVATMHELPGRVVALTTPAFKGEGSRFEEATGTPHREYPFDAYALAEDLDAFRRLLTDFPGDTDLVVNFTGGTKIMAVAAVLGLLAEAQSRTFRLIYLDTGRSAFESLCIGPDRRISPPEMVSVDLKIPFKAYLLLRGEQLISATDTIDEGMRERAGAARYLLKEVCDGFFRKRSDMDGRKGLKDSGVLKFSSRERSTKHSLGDGSLSWNAGGARFVSPDGREFEIRGDDAASFFAGSWLEEYCFSRLVESGKFDEVLSNARLDLRPETKERMHAREKLKNEIDLVVCKGLRAVLIECKAGSVHQDHIYKLAALRDHLLGSFGTALIVARLPVDASVREKAADLRIEIVMGNRILSLPGRVEVILEGS